MTTEQALLALVAALCIGVLALVAWLQARLTGNVKLELDLGALPLAQAIRERDQARTYAGALRDAQASVTPESDPTQAMQGAAPPVTPQRNTVTVTQPNRDARVTVTLPGQEPVTVPQEPDPELLATLEAKYNQTRT
jgi:hypothetical protein